MTNYGTIPVTSSEGTTIPFINHSKQKLKGGIAICRPWKEMVRSFNLPSGFSNTFGRMETNLNYFLMNYVIIVVLVLFFSLVNRPVSLIVFVALLFAFSMFLYFLRDKPQVIFHHSIHHNTVMFILSVITLIILLFTGAVVNVISALLIGAFMVEIHAFFRKTDDLFLDEEAAAAAGLITSSSC